MSCGQADIVAVQIAALESERRAAHAEQIAALEREARELAEALPDERCAAFAESIAWEAVGGDALVVKSDVWVCALEEEQSKQLALEMWLRRPEPQPAPTSAGGARKKRTLQSHTTHGRGS